MNNTVEYKDIYAFHPGCYLQDIIEEMEITQEEFAIRLGTSAKTISKVVNGEANLSKDLALKLSNMLGTSVDIWLNLQSTYDKKLLEIQNTKSFEEEKAILECIDYNYFVDLGVVPKTRDSKEKIINLRNYLVISNLKVLLESKFLVNYRTATSTVNNKNIINSKVWLQTAINFGKQIKVDNFDAKKLEYYIPEIRSMTIMSPEQFLPRLREIFSDCGVTFVLLPYLTNSNINGAVTWINRNKVILALNDRRNYADTFWFSLFHEIKHVLQQKHKQLFVSEIQSDLSSLDDRLEKEADSFASDVLIPQHEYELFLKEENLSDVAIRTYAAKIGIHPGILLGRLQHDQIVSMKRGAMLKEKYKIIL